MRGDSGNYALSTVHGVEKGFVKSAFQLGARRYATSFGTQCDSLCTESGEIEIQVPCIVLQFVLLQPTASCVFMGAYDVRVTGIDTHAQIARSRRSYSAGGTVTCKR